MVIWSQSHTHLQTILLAKSLKKPQVAMKKKHHNISMFNKCYSLYIHVYIQLHMFYRDKWCYRSILLLYTEYRQVHIIYKHEHLYVQLTWVLHCKSKHHTILPEISKQFQQSSLWILDNRESANQLQKKRRMSLMLQIFNTRNTTGCLYRFLMGVYMNKR